MTDVKPDTEIVLAEVYRKLLQDPNCEKELRNLSTHYPNFIIAGELTDAWGRPLIIRINPESGKFVIWSCGVNGKDETNVVLL